MAKDNNIKTVRDLIKSSREMGALSRRSSELGKYNQALNSSLPSMISAYCKMRSYESGTMTLEASSNAVATQLKFTSPTLIKKLQKRAEFSGLQRIDVKIGKAEPSTKKKTTPKRLNKPVTPRNTQLIRDTADNVSSTELGRSLRQLAETLERYGKQ